MDKIYSRTRIKFPKIKPDSKEKKIIIKIHFIIIFLITLMTTGYKVLKSIDPIFNGLCISKAKSIATEITNKKSTEVLAKYNYKDIVQMMKSSDGRNSIIKTDIVTVNDIASDIAVETQSELDKISQQTIEIPIGALIGNQYFSGWGPNIKIKIISVGDISTEIKTEFKSAGINQTIYRIYLNIESNVSILASYKTINQTINNQVLLVETVVIGEVPEAYLQLQEQ